MSPDRLLCTIVNKCPNSINYLCMVYLTLRIDNYYDNSGSKHMSNLGLLCCVIVPLQKQHNSHSYKHT